MQTFIRKRLINEQDVFDEINLESPLAAEKIVDDLFCTCDDAAIEERYDLDNGRIVFNVKDRNKKIIYALKTK